MNRSESIVEIAKALNKFQSECPAPKKAAVNPHFKSKYAPLEEIINTIKPILSNNGLSVIQSTTTEESNIVVTTLLMHESGEWIESDPLKLPMGKATAQGAGSSITYARRYSLSAMLNIAAEDDDDGNGATDQPSITQKQVGLLKAKSMELAKMRNVTLEKVYESLNITDITKLTQAQASRNIEQIINWIEKAGGQSES